MLLNIQNGLWKEKRYKGIDYLKFTECPMSFLLENTLKQVKDTKI